MKRFVVLAIVVILAGCTSAPEKTKSLPSTKPLKPTGRVNASVTPQEKKILNDYVDCNGYASARLASLPEPAMVIAMAARAECYKEEIAMRKMINDAIGPEYGNKEADNDIKNILDLNLAVILRVRSSANSTNHKTLQQKETQGLRSF